MQNRGTDHDQFQDPAVRRPGSRVRTRVTVLDGEGRSESSDFLATEEPLELRIALGGRTTRLAVTMRTPGADFELAAGFLLAEGVIGQREQIRSIRYCTDLQPGPEPGHAEPSPEPGHAERGPEPGHAERGHAEPGHAEPGFGHRTYTEPSYNTVTVELDPALRPDLTPLERHFTTTSACGVCGKASLDALRLGLRYPIGPGPAVDAQVLYALPERMRAAQSVFRATGGLHAAGLFSSQGELLAVREDVGRHNALDKLIGWALLRGRLPLDDCVLVVSGRASFELVQKALAAGIAILCAVSAPSSLAVEAARANQLTLVGFLRGPGGNVYAGADRIRTEP